jgi:hypothetical protein
MFLDESLSMNVRYYSLLLVVLLKFNYVHIYFICY